MKISTRTRYGIRAVLELAMSGGGQPLQLKVIAQHQDISIKYLEQLMAILKSAGFIRSVRGSKGGYMLARSPSLMKLSDLFNALEGPVITAECVQSADYCARAADCVAKQVWTQVQEAVHDVLDSITVQDLVDRARSKETLDYQI
jgi:Rrf2 family protein